MSVKHFGRRIPFIKSWRLKRCDLLSANRFPNDDMSFLISGCQEFTVAREFASEQFVSIMVLCEPSVAGQFVQTFTAFCVPQPADHVVANRGERLPIRMCRLRLESTSDALRSREFLRAYAGPTR